MVSLDEEFAAAHALAEMLMSGLKDDAGRVRVEDLVTAAATIVGERCIEAANDFDARSHDMQPGQRVFSDKVNDLIAGNLSSGTWSDFPATSVCGILRYVLTTKGKYTVDDFCSMADVFRSFAAGIGEGCDWGKVPLTIPSEHHPHILPLRLEYETRGLVDHLFANLGGDRQRKLTASVLCLSLVLVWVEDAIDKKLAIQLAMETVNGMSKTAPMTEQAFAGLQKSE